MLRQWRLLRGSREGHTVVSEADGAQRDGAVIGELVRVVEDLALGSRSIAGVESVLVLQAGVSEVVPAVYTHARLV